MFKGLKDGYVNCGKAMTVQGINVEVLSYEISKHQANIVCYYYMDGAKKVEVTYYDDLGNKGSEVYFFKDRYSNQH
jgi:hypothetical protein